MVAFSLALLVVLGGCTAAVADPDTITPVYEDLAGAMVWLGDNAPGDARVLAWWDYGKTIRELGGREPVIDAPSKEILHTVAMYSRMSEEELAAVRCPKCEPHGKVMGVVGALLAEDPSETARFMEEHDAEYLLATEKERAKLRSLLLIAGEDPSDYMESEFRPGPAASGFVVMRMVNGEAVPGFRKVYEGPGARIYRLQESG